MKEDRKNIYTEPGDSVPLPWVRLEEENSGETNFIEDLKAKQRKRSRQQQEPGKVQDPQKRDEAQRWPVKSDVGRSPRGAIN